MPQSIIDQIERWAQSQGATRSEAIRLLVEIALKAKK
jgi:CopG-like RHH_1 or ribbon-helix-helix domain, RHH_5